jgi:subtilisin family serine protease
MPYFNSYRKILLSLTISLVGTLLSLPAHAQLSTGAQDDLSPQAQEQIASIREWKQNLSPTLRKVQVPLLFAAKMDRGEPITSKISTLRSAIKLEPFSRVAIEIKGTITPDLVNVLKSAGATITSAPRNKKAIYLKIGLQQIEKLAQRPEITRISYAIPPVTNRAGGTLTGPNDGKGIVVSEGFYSHGIKSVHLNSKTRDGAPTRGQNVRVGVISDSNDFQEYSESSTDLPYVQVLTDDQGNIQDGRSGSGEGTAMMEIVHDLVPDAEIVFATAFNGQESFAQNILDLRFKMGCDVIVDDVTYLDESPFQDGPIARAVAAVRADGCLYFSSAGNQGNAYSGASSIWEGDFSRVIPTSGALAGLPVQRFGNNSFNYNLGVATYAFLFWSDPLGASNNDYDIYAVSNDGLTILDGGVDFQTGTQDPFEYMISYPGERIYVHQYSALPRYFHLDLFGSSGALLTNTPGNVRGHNGSKDSLSVAATTANTVYPYPLFTVGQGIEYFSSDGPRREFFYGDGTPITPNNYLARTGGGRTLNKPDFTGADGVLTTLTDFAPFYGTSAAAPHVAAIAALVKSANPDISNDEILRLMRDTGLDILDPGFDTTSGAGIPMGAAADAVTNFLETPTVSAITDTTATITWKSKSAVDTYVEYGPTTTYGSVSADGTLDYTHSVTLTGLTPGTNYNFRLKGTYIGFTQTSQNYTFRTTGGSVPVLAIDSILLRREVRTNNLLADIVLKNTTGGTAKDVVIDRAALGISSPVPSSQLPLSLGDIPFGTNKTFTLKFGSQRSGTTPVLRLTGKSSNGLTPTFSLTFQTRVP